jgi:BirA family biotin operon repressor/biotin-[acetyl-CoA-carboxylase] ligase
VTTIPEYYVPVVPSTMDVARTIARGLTHEEHPSPHLTPVRTDRRTPDTTPDDLSAPPDLFRVRTDHQTAGRGRRGNHWFDRPGDAVMMTIALRRGSVHDPADLNPGTLALRAGAILLNTLTRRELDTAVTVKWPNDILHRGRKVAGILVEADTRWFYIGIGINAYDPDETVRALYSRAVADESGSPGSNASPAPNAHPPVVTPGTIRDIPDCPVGDELIRRFDSSFFRLIRGDGWYRIVADNLAWLDSHVTVGDATTEITGTFRGISPDGAALIGKDGVTTPWYTGTMRRAESAR